MRGHPAIILHTTVNNIKVDIDLPGVTEGAYGAVASLLESQLADESIKNREAIGEAFRLALASCPAANPSDLWHHVVYRLYFEILPKYRPQNPGQSWVRASGDALEIALERIYTPVLKPHKIGIRALISHEQRSEALQYMGIGGEVGDSKLDVLLSLTDQWGAKSVFGGVHVKASLAERVSDDVPCSRAMQKRGLFSPLFTLDVKSFPPPHGDLVNRGELGTPAAPSEKRKYVENHGDFDNCYSGNFRSQPSNGDTPSGKKIILARMAEQPDAFAKETITRGEAARAKLSK